MYKVTKNGIKNLDTGVEFQAITTLPEFEEYLEWKKKGNVALPEFTDLELLENSKKAKIEVFKKEFDDALKVGFMTSKNIKMDAYFKDVNKLDSGHRLAVKVVLTSMDVTDFDNVEHELSLPVVNEIIKELGVNYMSLRTIFINKRKLVNDAIDIEEASLIQ